MRIPLLVLLLVLMMIVPAPGQKRFTPAAGQSAPPLLLTPTRQDSIVDIIVEFVEEPLLLAGRHELAATAGFYQSRFAQFTADVTHAGAAMFSNAPRREFHKIFFGVSTSVPEKTIDAIEALSYVRQVHREREVTAHLTESSLEQIRVPEAWAKYDTQGEGVLVGVIDSGIDYFHPALGGGIGPDHKVVGGFDFVNNDTDPMDDNGHGTHVAGIIAADGASVKGVAPKARLLSYKALDAYGRGREHDILAAIERAVDPDQNGDPVDKVDILNMSLGSDYGDPDDPLSRAVDNAVNLGITVVVSAGNAGRYTPVEGKEDNYYYTAMETIGSPGTARLAITVGAVDSLDNLTRFSSKGPAGGTFAVKPDLVAPGEAIWSLAPGGGVAQKSGTSMAAPMVAGIAALLKSKRGDLSPLEIKSALMHSSVDLGLSVMKQGAGRVDAMRALQSTTLITPGTLSFGLDDPAAMVWTTNGTITIVNRNVTSQTYSLIVSGTPPGVTVSSIPDRFVLAPGSEQTVLVTLSVDNIAVPAVDEDIIIRDGVLAVMGTADTLRVPWAFVRTSRLILAFSDPSPLFLGMSDKSYIVSRTVPLGPRVRWLDTRHAEVVGAVGGIYDFAVYFPSAGALTMKEQVDFQGSGTMEFNAGDATHRLSYESRDETGQPFPATAKTRRTLRVDVREGVPLFVALPEGAASLALSPVSTRVLFHPLESFIDAGTAKRVVLPQYTSFRGITGNISVAPAGTGYKKQTLRFKVPPGVAQFKLYSEIINIKMQDGVEYYNPIQLGIDTLESAGGQASLELALMKPEDPVYFASVGFYVNAGDLSQDYLDYSTRYFSAPGDSVMLSLPSQRSLVAPISPDGGTMTLGSGPVHILNLSYNNLVGPSIQFDPRFRGGLLEERYTDAVLGRYAIFNQIGEKLTEGSLNSSRTPYLLGTGVYRTEIESENFFVGNVRGKVRLVSTMDLGKTPADAPYITSFSLLDSSGGFVDHLAGHEQGTLQFSSRVPAIEDRLPVADSTRAFYRRHGTADWISLPLTVVGSEGKGVGLVFRAPLISVTALDSAGIDIRVRVVDAAGNSSDMVVAPAFAVGPWVGDGTSGVEDGGGVPVAFALEQNYPNPFNPNTAIKYTVGVVSGQSPVASRVRLVVYDILGREVKVLMDEMKGAGKYEVQFDGSGLSSGVYLYRMEAGGFVQTRKLMLLK
jgi:subtilisin family serine protease